MILRRDSLYCEESNFSGIKRTATAGIIKLIILDFGTTIPI
jgi:hypothetical protein